MDTSVIYEYSSHKPEYNFPNRKIKQNPEAEFAEQFARSYQRKFLEIHSRTSKQRTLFIREVPVSGNGIADLLVFSWAHVPGHDIPSPFELKNFAPTLRSFEIKLSNWRRGLMQAHRYCYFSHASILVLPWNKLKAVETQLNMFKILRIGLWLFEPETDRIMNIFTPRPREPRMIKYTQKAIDLTVEAVSS